MLQETLVTEELMARQPPETQAIMRILLARIAEVEARWNQTPRNSSRASGTEHPQYQTLVIPPAEGLLPLNVARG